MKRLLLTILSLSAAAAVSAQTLEMKVNVNRLGAEIQPTMPGSGVVAIIQTSRMNVAGEMDIFNLFIKITCEFTKNLLTIS